MTVKRKTARAKTARAKTARSKYCVPQLPRRTGGAGREPSSCVQEAQPAEDLRHTIRAVLPRLLQQAFPPPFSVQGVLRLPLPGGEERGRACAAGSSPGAPHPTPLPAEGEGTELTVAAPGALG